MKSFLITGGAGFIGSNIADALVLQSPKVTVLDNLSTGSLSNVEHIKDKIIFYEGDIRDFDMVMRASKSCDVIFHEAALVSVPQSVANPLESTMINDVGTLHVLEAARRNKVRRVVLASSSAVYGDDPNLPKREDMLPLPKSPYAVQKMMGEYYARLYHELYDIETVCLRYFNVYGPRQDPSSPYSGVISVFLKNALQNGTPIIYGDGEQYRDFIFVRDVVRANLMAAGTVKAAGKVFNIGMGGFVRINELLNIVCELTGVNISPSYAESRAGDIRESVANVELVKNLLGFKPEYTFKEGLKQTFEWYKQSLEADVS